MALNNSGIMSIGGSTVGASINLELELSATANSSLSQTNFRELAEVPDGQINMSDFYGKSNVENFPIDTNTSDFVLSPSIVPGYVAGEANVRVSIGIGTYLYSSSTSAALTISGFAAGDKIEVLNEGFIQGKGGQGGDGYPWSTAGNPGYSAIQILNSVGAEFTIINNGYLLGGGGGGGGTLYYCSGGGGAGNGAGGKFLATNSVTYYGGSGGLPGGVGSNGNLGYDTGGGEYQGGSGGGGGGMYGSGGSAVRCTIPNYIAGLQGFVGLGGASGGSGGAYIEWLQSNLLSGIIDSGAGGGNSAPGGNAAVISWGNTAGVSTVLFAGGGGGGWGASGGYGLSGRGGFIYPNGTISGGVGGKAIALNGATVTFSGTGTTAGAIS